MNFLAKILAKEFRVEFMHTYWQPKSWPETKQRKEYDGQPII
jgi:hypothetical protein